MTKEERITEIDAQLSDISTAKQQAAKMGKGPGDYDLATMAAAAGRDRVIAAAKEELVQQEMYQNATAPQVSQPTQNVNAVFKVGDDDYTLIKDSDETRKMIKYTPEGKVDPLSEVIPLGVNQGGGFILAAPHGTKLEKDSLPMTRTEKGYEVNYPQSKTDPELMYRLSQEGVGDIGSLIDENAVKDIRGMYYGK